MPKRGGEGQPFWTSPESFQGKYNEHLPKTDSSQMPTEVTVSSTEKTAETLETDSPTSNSYQELFKLNSTSEENPSGEETGSLSTIKVIPSSMMGYYQTNFSHSIVEVEGKIRKVFLK